MGTAGGSALTESFLALDRMKYLGASRIETEEQTKTKSRDEGTAVSAADLPVIRQGDYPDKERGQGSLLDLG